MQLKQMIDNGDINVTPDFQRYYVWKEPERRSMLIESLMLNFPLPLFYVSENFNGVWDVVDGLQRISTICDFLNNEIRLKGLQYLSVHNGLFFHELPLKYKQRILNTALIFIVIDSRTPIQAKYDIFRRVNTGGVPLNAMEIRNSVATPHVRGFLNRLSKEQTFRRLAGLRDERMQPQELALRFCAFMDGYDPGSGVLRGYKGLEPYLDVCFERMNRTESVDFIGYERCFTHSMELAESIFGSYAFRKVYPAELRGQHKISRPFNKALFTSLSVVLSYVDSHAIRGEENRIALYLAELIANHSVFADSISRSTASVANIHLQFEIIHQMIGGYFRHDLTN